MRQTTHKYHAKATTVDGIRFHSQKEATRYGELLLLGRAGEIWDLELQPRYELLAPMPQDHPLVGKRLMHIGTYIADFAYTHQYGGRVVEDVKGFKTPLYRWKKKHVEAQYGIFVVEV